MNLPTKLIASAALSLLTLLASLSHASDTDNDNKAAAKPVQKLYKVEVIIFTQKDMFGDELSSRDILLAYPKNLIDLENNSAAIIALPEDKLELGPEAYALKRTGVYTVLYHKAWQQPGLIPDKAPWIYINKIVENTALNGSLRVYLSSYLHVESNIWQVRYATTPESTSPQPLDNAILTVEGSLQAPPDSAPLPVAPTPWPQPPTSPIALSTLITEEQSTSHVLNPIIAGVEEPIAVQKNIEEIILLKQASRIKLNKLHYFDHPKMGLLLKVSRSKVPIVKD